MRCVITGVETENKWKNIPVSKDALVAAKKFIEIEPWLDMRSALKKLDKDFTELLKNNAGTFCKEQKNTEVV